MQIHAAGASCAVSEPIFVPASTGADEGEGHLLAVIFDERRRTSELAVFDAADIERGPIARALLDHRVPMGFHGLWKSSRERPESP